jgi:phosphomannomutase
MTHVAGKEVTWLRDLRGDGRDTRCPGNVPSLPTMPDAEMLTLELDGELTLTLRTSGTEPKLKFYSEIAGEVGVDRAKLAADLEKALGECIEELLDPEGIGLVAQSA